MLFTSCASDRNEALNLYGDEEAVEAVQKMLQKMGGAERWKNIEAIYIHAVHHEKRLEKPYESKIWRNLVGPEIKIVQWNEDFRIKRYISGDNGWIRRNEENAELLSSGTLGWLKNWDKHLFYRTIHRLAKGESLILKWDKGAIIINENEEFHSSIELGKNGYPYRYGTPTVEGDTSYTLYTMGRERRVPAPRAINKRRQHFSV